MSGSPFKPPDGMSPDSSLPDLAGVPPITILEREQSSNSDTARRGRFQFSLRSLLLFATGVSVFVSLVAWLGFVFFMVTMMLAGVITVFVGTYLLDNRVILAGGIMMVVSSVLSPLMFIFAEF
jgi:hypothetical protein